MSGKYFLQSGLRVLELLVKMDIVYEEMDLTDLYSTYDRINSLSPRTLLKITEDELRLCAPEPGAGAWGTAWFWNFKKK